MFTLSAKAKQEHLFCIILLTMLKAVVCIILAPYKHKGKTSLCCLEDGSV